MVQRSGRLAVVLGIDVAAVVTLSPVAVAAGRHARHPRGWVARDGLDGAIATLAGAALWVLACWVALGLCGATLARTPGGLGRAGAALARILPRAVRRAVVGSVLGSAGLTVLLSPLVPAGATGAAGAALPSDGPGGRPTVSVDIKEL